MYILNELFNIFQSKNKFLCKAFEIVEDYLTSPAIYRKAPPVPAGLFF